MTREEIQALIRRVDDYSFDVGSPKLTFADRLAREQHWTPEYTERVLQEYKRFTILAVAADHPVTPSVVVDEAWHLHLIYTRSYWDEYCDQVLQRPLHHHPTAGGPEEYVKHLRQYAQTLASYRTIFHASPPPDIWPPLGAPSPQVHPGNWLRSLTIFIRRICTLRTAAIWLLLIGALALAGCQAQQLKQFNIFNWQGQPFLIFYMVLIGIAFVAALIVRRGAPIEPEGTDREAVFSDPYRMACLAGGPPWVVFTAMVKMLQEGTLGIKTFQQQSTILGIKTSSKVSQITPGASLPAGAAPIEQEIALIVDQAEDVTVRKILKTTLPMAEEYTEDLQQRGLLEQPENSWSYRGGPFLILMTAFVVGAIKLGVGITRDKPVGFLVLLLVINGGAALFMLVKRWRTPAGETLVKDLRSDHVSLRSQANRSAHVEPSTLLLAAGLFGIGTLQNNLHVSQLRGVLNNGKAFPLSGTGYLGSCGGTGCGGGGGGCGGGAGCGGGGCGGCGN